MRNTLAVAGLVARRELRCAFRDKQAWMHAVVLPLCLYPVLFWVLLQGLTFARGRERAADVELAVSVPAGVEALDSLGDALRSDAGAPGATRLVYLTHAQTAELVRGVGKELEPERVRALLRADADGEPFDALLQVEPDGATLWFDSSLSRSQLARDRISRALDALVGELRERALDEADVAPESVRGLPWAARNLASQRDMGGYLLSFLLPMLLVFMATSGAFVPAVDCTAGERERGTAETTRLAPVPELAVHLGKLAAVSVSALLAALLNLAGLALAARHLIAMLPDSQGTRGFSIEVPLSSLALALPFAALFAVFASAVLVAVSSRAETFKQGQSTLGSVQIAFLAPALAGALPGLSLTPALALVPVLQVVLACKAILQAGAAPLPWAELGIAAASLVAWSALAVLVSVRLLSRGGVR